MKDVIQRLMPAILSLHQDIYQAIQTYLKQVGIITPTLLDFFVMPVNLEPKLSPQQHQDVKDWLLNSLPGVQLKAIVPGIYNLTDTAVLEGRRDFVQNILMLSNKKPGQGWMVSPKNYADQILLNPPTTIHSLSEVSQFATKASTLLAIKFCVIHLANQSGELDENLLAQYQGLPSQSEPVRHACKVLWGTEYKSLMPAKSFTSAQAKECGMSEINFNSALWILGQKMRS